MARLPINFPPGVYRNGTPYQAKGRYYDTFLVRWYGSALGPIGGWRSRSDTKVSGSARAIIVWKDNTNVAWIGIGTHTKLYASNRLGNVYDITPAGFTTGRADATAAGGYGSGAFGSGTFGTPRVDAATVLDATQWSLDKWGQNLVGVSSEDKNIVEWTLNTANPAAKVTNSPACSALVVTPERFLFALGTTDPRTVSWCDQEDNTVWTPASTNQAGSFPLQTGGNLMCGVNVRGGTVLLADTDVFLASYRGGVDVYGFDKVGESCGAISRRSATAISDSTAVWMSQSGFWMYNGFVQPIPCEIFDYIRRDINLLQKSKITVNVLSEFSEVEWHYCSSASMEIDRCVVWNYVTGIWMIGRPTRFCGIDKGILNYPVMVGSDGTIYDHEVGYAYDGGVPYAETGPIELGNGDNVAHVRGLIPDDITLGDVSATFYTTFYPNEAEVTYGPYTLASKTDVRFCGRQIRFRIDGVVGTNWRFGTPRLEGTIGGMR